MRPCPHCDRYQLLSKVMVAGSDEPLFEYRCANGHISTWEQVERERAEIYASATGAVNCSTPSG